MPETKRGCVRFLLNNSFWFCNNKSLHEKWEKKYKRKGKKAVKMINGYDNDDVPTKEVDDCTVKPQAKVFYLLFFCTIVRCTTSRKTNVCISKKNWVAHVFSHQGWDEIQAKERLLWWDE